MKILNLLFLILIVLGKFSIIISTSVEELRMCAKEIMYSYYMRGPNIQYHASKHFYFSPEEATSHNINYFSCTPFTTSVYMELFNIVFPMSEKDIVSYANENFGKRPEVVAFSNINSEDKIEMKVYNGKTLYNPTFEQLLPLIQIGDILYQTGHGLIIYDIIKDNKGKVIDAVIMQSAFGKGKTFIKSKMPRHIVYYPNGNEFVGATNTLYLNKKYNSDVEEGNFEGTVGMVKFSKYVYWANMTNPLYRYKNYIIFRIIHENSDKNAILKFIGGYYSYKSSFKDGDLLELTIKNKDRLKFKHLYIEKIVNKRNNNIVEYGDYLNYKIIVKNAGKEDYKDDLIVIENISQYVTYEIHYESKENIYFENNSTNKQLKWNIGKLKSNEEVTISYIVRITSGKPNDIIESIGFVNNINSSTIKNIIGINLNQNQKNYIKKNFEKLKKKYTGKKLINEIYKKSFQLDMNFDEFNITNLIIDKDIESTLANTISLNEDNKFYNSILNKYWSKLAMIKHSYIQGGAKQNIYNLKRYQFFKGEKGEGREDFIYKESFQTGDILIYKNSNDTSYEVENEKLIKNNITYEDGEYAYIYIEGKGFVGVNLGNDGIVGTKDDRNEFNVKYYKYNNLNVCEFCDNSNEEDLEIYNLQTLFGKDYYVILRPSLGFDIINPKQNKIVLIIFILIFVILIFSIGILILKKYLEMKKNKQEFTLNNLKKNLI